MVTLLDIGWLPHSPTHWKDPEGRVWHLAYGKADHPWPRLQYELCRIIEGLLWTAAALWQEVGGIEGGFDWSCSNGGTMLELALSAHRSRVLTGRFSAE